VTEITPKAWMGSSEALYIIKPQACIHRRIQNQASFALGSLGANLLCKIRRGRALRAHDFYGPPATYGFGVALKALKTLKMLAFSPVLTPFSHKTVCRGCV
jgi:hypothetical protein